MADAETAARASLKAKIAALRSKTVQAGCTEAEALAAAAIAARLMAEHGLDEAEMRMSEAEALDPSRLLPWQREISGVMALCTNTHSIVTRVEREGATVLFVGRAPGPEIAVYLRDVCFQAVEGALAVFQEGLIYRSRRGIPARRHAADQFCEAMARRLSTKLLDLFQPSLDVAARAEAGAALDRRFPDVVTRRIPARAVRDSSASRAGRAAGDRVAIHHGVDSAGAPLRLSRARP